MKNETEKLKKKITTLEKENTKLQKENMKLIVDKNSLTLDLKKARLDFKELRIDLKIHKMKSDEKTRSLEAEIIDVKKSRPTAAELLSHAGEQLKKIKKNT